MIKKTKGYLNSVLIVLLLAILIVTISACQLETSLSDVVVKVIQNVVEITGKEEGKFDSKGTAFFIDDTTIVTNAHVITYKEADEYYAYNKIFVKNEELDCLVKVISFDIVKDIAVLKVENINQRKDITYNEQSLQYAEEVFTIGNLNGYGLACNAGIISAPQKTIVKKDEEQSYIQTDIEISEGNSGGPLCNSSGQIIGMMAFKLRDANSEYIDGVSFAIPISIILDFYNKTKKAWQKNKHFIMLVFLCAILLIAIMES